MLVGNQDRYIQKKYFSYLRNKNKNKGPNFYDRMEEDILDRKIISQKMSMIKKMEKKFDKSKGAAIDEDF